MTSFLSAEGGPIRIKFRRLFQYDMSTAVKWSKSKPEVEFQYGGCLGEFNGMSSQSHVSRCGIGLLSLGEFTVNIPVEPRATYSVAACKNSIRHIENRFFAIFDILFCFAVWALTSGGFRIVSESDTLLHLLLNFT